MTLSAVRPVCLIRPPAAETFRFATTSITPPLGLAYIAAALEAAGQPVHVVDAVAEAPDTVRRYFRGYLIGLPFDDIARRIPADAKLVGISVVFTHEWPAVVRLIDSIKRLRPEVPVVLGGEHITSMPEFCLRTSKADILVLGEGEETVVDLARVLDQGKTFDAIDGIGFRTGEAVVINRRRARTQEIDNIAWPAWHHINLELYHARRWMGGMYSSTKSVPILATRGCPYQCTYCSAPNMWTPKWIPRDPAKVADEIQYYVEHWGARNFPFQDLTAIIKREWIIAFCKELIGRGLKITWQMPTGTRSEAIDAEVAELLRQTGLISMAYAPESGSEQTRQFIKKKMKTDRLFESMQAAVKSDLNVCVFVVIGFPHDRDEHLEENLPFLDKLVDIGITDLSVGFYMALPGTEIFDSLYDHGKIRIDRTYFRHILAANALAATSSYCDELSVMDLTRWKSRLYRRFYGRKRANARDGLVSTIRQSVRQLWGDGGDTSKLQTAMRNGLVSGIETIKAQMRKGWMPRSEERRLFEPWDAIYREIRAENVRNGVHRVAPADTRQLHQSNVLVSLKAANSVRRTVPLHSA